MLVDRQQPPRRLCLLRVEKTPKSEKGRKEQAGAGGARKTVGRQARGSLRARARARSRVQRRPVEGRGMEGNGGRGERGRGRAEGGRRMRATVPGESALPAPQRCARAVPASRKANERTHAASAVWRERESERERERERGSERERGEGEGGRGGAREGKKGGAARARDHATTRQRRTFKALRDCPRPLRSCPCPCPLALALMPLP